MALDIALDAMTHDIILEDGDIWFIDNAERIAQQIKIQLWTFYGEWFMNTEWGVPYLEYVLVKNPNLSLIENIFREQILLVDDVDRIDSLSLDYDPQKRTLAMEYTVSTTYGMLTRSEFLGYGKYLAG